MCKTCIDSICTNRCAQGRGMMDINALLDQENQREQQQKEAFIKQHGQVPFDFLHVSGPRIYGAAAGHEVVLFGLPSGNPDGQPIEQLAQYITTITPAQAHPYA